jgi:hypothetical protein
MATTFPAVEQAQASQKQILDAFVSNYQKLIDLTPAQTPVRSAAELALEYFNRTRSILESVSQTGVEDPQALVEKSLDSLKLSSDLNLEFTNKYMELYRDFAKQYAVTQN